MLKLKKYYKSFIWSILFIICLLSIEAICDLKLPDYMSDIVNTGIQSGGIEHSAPSAISEKAMNLINAFMSEEEKEYVLKNYTKINIGDTEYLSDYPVLDTENIYLLNDVDSKRVKEIDSIFSVSSKTMVNVLMSLSESSQNNNSDGINKDDSNSNQQNLINIDTSNVDLSKLYEMMPMIAMLPEEKINNLRQEALETDETTLSSIGKVFARIFYKEIGLDTSKIQQDYIIKIGIKMLGVSLLGAIITIVVGYFASKIGAGVSKTLRKDIFEKVQGFSSEEFNKFSSASLITRTTNDVTQIQNATTMGLRMLLYSPILGIGGVLMMLQKGRDMAWTLLLGLVAVFILILVLFKVVMPKFKLMQKLTDKLNLVSKENLTGVMVIRAFGTQKYEEKRFDEVNVETTDVNRFTGRVMGFMMPCMMLIMNLLSVLIIWVGADMISKSALQVGDMMAFMQYAMQVIMSFVMLAIMFVMIPRANISANRISEVLETESKINNPQNPVKFNTNKKGYVEFKDVSFIYQGAAEKVLNNINFTAKPGETTAFIGSTGSGKSTLINLIPRLYDVTEGEILVNGVNVKDVNLSELREQIGYIPQKGSLLSGTIEKNLKYGNSEASDDFMKECSKVAQATEFIESKEDEYQSEISQGGKNVSGGQKQRLSIARALVKNSSIYIFDDSFSALDFETDAKLREALKSHTGNSTILIVAQRVNTIMNAEQIIVLEEGKIVGKGTHEELLKNCPTYYEIASSQLTKEELENGRK